MKLDTNPKKSRRSPEVAVQHWPADKVERWAIGKLIPHARNARTHSDEQVAQLAASMREWGFTVPVLVDDGGTLIAGHGRVLAARKLGWGEIPVMVAAGWSDAQKRAYMIADNRLPLNAAWDAELLAVELDDLRDLGADLKLTGFTQQELNDLIGTAGLAPGLTDPDSVPPVADPVSRAGDLWVMGGHRLLCGDATNAEDVARVLGGDVPVLMVTDPPYGVDYDPNWRNEAADKGLIAHAARRVGIVTNDDRVDWTPAWDLSPCDVAYCWHAGRHASQVQRSLEASRYEIRCQLIWAKPRFAISRGHYNWQHEPCWYAVRKGETARWKGDHSQATLWQISLDKNIDGGHSTQKPVECMSRAIRNHAAPCVYDPFLGSGTTIIAAEQLGRRCYALEIAPQYIDVSVRRWQNFTGKQATLEATGQTFEEVTIERQKTDTDSPEAGKGQSGKASATAA